MARCRSSLLIAALVPLLEFARGAEEHPWEWAGVFPLVVGETYTWSAARGANNAYAAATMKLAVVLLPANNNSIKAVKEDAEALFVAAPATWSNATSGATLALSGAKAYSLTFDQGSWLSIFKLQPAASGNYSFFTEHLPSEFEKGFHFMKDEHGKDVEVLEEESHANHSGHDDHTDHDDHGHSEDAHAGHDHQEPKHGDEEHAWEWAGIFALDAGETYTWSAARGATGAYAAAGMKLVVVALPAGSYDVHAAEDEAEKGWAAPTTWSNATSGATLALSGAKAYSLTFDQESWVSLFKLQPAVSGSYAFFTEHLPSEFENGFHYLKDEHGHDVEVARAPATTTGAPTSLAPRADSPIYLAAMLALLVGNIR